VPAVCATIVGFGWTVMPLQLFASSVTAVVVGPRDTKHVVAGLDRLVRSGAGRGGDYRDERNARQQAFNKREGTRRLSGCDEGR
jgi:hypothetical protein